MKTARTYQGSTAAECHANRSPRTRLTLRVVAVGIALALGAVGCSASSGENSASPTESDIAETTVQTVAPTPEQTAAPTTEQTAAPTTVAAPTTTEATTPAAASWVMPDETGKDLQTAQDDIQALTGNELFFTSSTDATGQDRFQVLDRNWIVCSQVPAAGSTITAESTIDFSVVKIGESCP